MPKPFIKLLTASEIRVFQKIFELKTSKEMASELHLSRSCIKYHKQKIFRKAGLDSLRNDKKTVALLRKFGRFRVDVRWIPNLDKIFKTN